MEDTWKFDIWDDVVNTMKRSHKYTYKKDLGADTTAQLNKTISQETGIEVLSKELPLPIYKELIKFALVDGLDEQWSEKNYLYRWGDIMWIGRNDVGQMILEIGEELPYIWDTEEVDLDRLNFVVPEDESEREMMLGYAIFLARADGIITDKEYALLLILAQSLWFEEKHLKHIMSVTWDLVTTLQLVQKQNRELQETNEIIKQQNEEIIVQRDQITDQQRHTKSSITYAKRIQEVVMENNKVDLNNHVSDYFILNKPRDGVSGDFYWYTQVGNTTIIAVADCTGHGVPWAFMSMLGMSFLNEIVNWKKVIEPNYILNNLRSDIKNALNQTGKTWEQKDGMDIALITIEHITEWDDAWKCKVKFSWANNPLYYIQENESSKDNEVVKIKADRMPIGVYVKDSKKFAANEVVLDEWTSLYLFSDGFVDQNGWPKWRKFLSKNFKETLLSIQHLPMSEQLIILNKIFDEWKWDKGQVDDVLVMGVRL